MPAMSRVVRNRVGAVEHKCRNGASNTSALQPDMVYLDELWSFQSLVSGHSVRKRE